MNETASIRIDDCHIYFYGDLDHQSALELILALRETDEWIASYADCAEGGKALWLHINSDGGMAFDALAVIDHIHELETPINAIIEGRAASSAALIALSCTHCYMRPNAYIMLHNMRNEFSGNFSQFQDEMKLMNSMLEHMVTLMAKATDLNVADIHTMLARDTWMDANEALDKHLIDGIKGHGQVQKAEG